jgi:DUF1680 family protein
MNRFDSLDLADVQVAGELGRRIDLTMKAFLLDVDVDTVFLDLIRRKDAPGFEAMAAGGYLGLGKFIDSAVHFAKYTGDRNVVAFKSHLVEEVLQAQLDDGYVGVMQPSSRIKYYWDLNEVVYLIHALVNDYRLFNNRASLTGAARAADYIMKNRGAATDPLDLAKTNIERAFLALSEATGDRKYQDYVIEGVKLREWRDEVGGQHAYAFMNLCLAQLDLYEREPSEALRYTSHAVVDYLTRQDGLLIHGSCSRNERFHDNQDGTGDIAETCATAYLIRLMDKLLRLEGTPLCGDIMERAIFNALFAAQSVDGRKVRYFTAVEGKRLYCTERWPQLPEHTFCCPNNFRRIVSELPALVYYQSDRTGLLINLYAPSQASMRVKNHSIRVSQKTDYPTSGDVQIQVDPDQPVTFPISLRIPAWSQASRLSVNGTTEQTTQAGSFHTIERKWERGDRITLHFPMEWRWIKGQKTQKGRVALMRGPMLFCLSPHLEGNQVIDLEPKEIVLDIESLSEPINDETIRPGGTACRVKGWKSRTKTTAAHELDLRLTEFPDPGGEAVWFLPL